MSQHDTHPHDERLSLQEQNGEYWVMDQQNSEAWIQTDTLVDVEK